MVRMYDNGMPLVLVSACCVLFCFCIYVHDGYLLRGGPWVGGDGAIARSFVFSPCVVLVDDMNTHVPSSPLFLFVCSLLFVLVICSNGDGTSRMREVTAPVLVFCIVAGVGCRGVWCQVGGRMSTWFRTSIFEATYGIYVYRVVYVTYEVFHVAPLWLQGAVAQCIFFGHIKGPRYCCCGGCCPCGPHSKRVPVAPASINSMPVENHRPDPPCLPERLLTISHTSPPTIVVLDVPTYYVYFARLGRRSGPGQGPPEHRLDRAPSRPASARPVSHRGAG